MGDGRSRRLASLPLILVFVAIAGLEAAPHLGDVFHRTARPAAAASPLPGESPARPPAPPPNLGRVRPNVDVFWLIGRGARWMVAYDWSGRAVGTLARVASAASPDGQRLWSDGAFVDAQGDFLARPRLPDGAFTWETGSQGVCGYDGGLWTYALGAPAVRRVRAFTDPDGAVAGCSFGRDLALVASGAPDKPRSLAWVRLSTGALLARKGYPPDDLGDVVVSRDFRYFAENYYSETRPVTYGVPPSTIRTVDGGALVAGRGDLVTAFSGDSAEVATVIFGGGAVGVFTLPGGSTVWSAAPGAVPDLYAAPAGAEFVGESVVAGSLNVVLVHRDGTVQTLPAAAFDSLLKPG